LASNLRSKSRSEPSAPPKESSPAQETLSSERARIAPALALPSLDRGSTVRDLLSAGLEALDLLNIGLIVCSASAEVLVANQTAEQILQARDGLELDSDGALSTTHDEHTSLVDLVRSVGKAPRTPEAVHRDSAFAVPRAAGKRPLTLFLRAVNTKSDAPAPNEAAVLVMILDAAQPVETAEAELRQLYGFTTTEARLANHLMEGLSLEDCCRAMGIRRTTARMHLRNIFAKTGVRRQGELVSLLLKSIGLGPRLR
jgi:DNA-binding CsgD family transcriptional regulator